MDLNNVPYMPKDIVLKKSETPDITLYTLW